ncbi:RNA polymerase sigma factor [Flavivirga eckloniae]|uniref:RNA polymerase sigma-70 factor n=1 Tax=Flavivirga eckloniae TaxID=1803846 RepID=A0A2K9PSD1_9FLAO|nr:RNA polymerase sigma factor [Flavivirga eckloniae]AUP79974.1 RNA polymerase sigma-70 factor [Flavivirga eckloniae]
MDNTYTNDIDLLLKLSKSDKKAYRFIYTNYYDNLCVYLYSFTNNDQLAEDIAQDILLKLWEKREQLKIHSSLKSYLYKSAYNAFINNYKSRKRINEKLEAIKFTKLNQMENKIEDIKIMEQRLLYLKSAIDELPPKCKEALLLSKIEGYKYKEIAEVMNISVKTVENHIAHAFKLLRGKMTSKKFLLFFVNFFKTKLLWES